MKKTACSLLMLILMIFGFSNPADSSYSGEWMFTLNGNDSNYGESSLEDEINGWFDDHFINRTIDLEFYSKIDVPSTSISFMTVTYDPDMKSGAWLTSDPIEFYTVKGADQFAFYWINGGADSGTWSTEHLLTNGDQQPTISHLSTWNSLDTPPNANVPEPTTLMLLGFGLIGLAGVGRRAMKK